MCVCNGFFARENFNFTVLISLPSFVWPNFKRRHPELAKPQYISCITPQPILAYEWWPLKIMASQSQGTRLLSLQAELFARKSKVAELRDRLVNYRPDKLVKSIDIVDEKSERRVIEESSELLSDLLQREGAIKPPKVNKITVVSIRCGSHRLSFNVMPFHFSVI